MTSNPIILDLGPAAEAIHAIMAKDNRWRNVDDLTLATKLPRDTIKNMLHRMVKAHVITINRVEACGTKESIYQSEKHMAAPNIQCNEDAWVAHMPMAGIRSTRPIGPVKDRVRDRSAIEERKEFILQALKDIGPISVAGLSKTIPHIKEGYIAEQLYRLRSQGLVAYGGQRNSAIWEAL